MAARASIAALLLFPLATWAPVHALADLPDPTRPFALARPAPSSAPAARPELVLQLTLVSPLRRIALINGRTVEVGASVEGAVVADIKPYEVILRRAGRETRLRFFPPLTERSGE